MSTKGVIINPVAGRGRGKGLALAHALEAVKKPDVSTVVLRDFNQLEPALEVFAAKNIDTLFISSGDGTVHAIQTWLAESGRFARLPRLCLLPHGTTNMTAADLGFAQRNIMEQINFIYEGEAKSIRQRPTVRVVNPREKGPLHGMFFGVGAVAEASLYCQRVFNDRGIGGSWATFATLATAVAKSLFLPANHGDPNRFDKPYSLTFQIDGANVYEGQHLTMLATTLEKLILSSKPFWGGATGPIRTTVIPYPPPSIPRWVIPALYGKEDRKAPPGAISRACKACEIRCNTRLIIDGEFYELPETEPLRIETGPVFDFIVA